MGVRANETMTVLVDMVSFYAVIYYLLRSGERDDDGAGRHGIVTTLASEVIYLGSGRIHTCMYNKSTSQ